MAINWSSPITPEAETPTRKPKELPIEFCPEEPKYSFDEIILPQDVRKKIPDVADCSTEVIQWQSIGRRR